MRVDVLAHLLDFCLHIVSVFVAELEWGRRLVLNGVYHNLCKVYGTVATFHEGIVHGKSYTLVLAVLAEYLELVICICSKAVERYDYALTIFLEVLDVAVEIVETTDKSFGIWLLNLLYRHTAVHLQALSSGNDNSEFRLETALTALDVVELLCTEVCTESSLCDDIVGEGHGHLRCYDSVTAMCYVGERTTMYKGWSIFCSLYEIRIYGIHEKNSDGTTHAHVLDTERSVVGLDSEDYMSIRRRRSSRS